MKFDKESYINHIKDKEQIINMRQVLDKIEITLRRHTAQHTDFLDPYQRTLAKSILNRFTDISYRELGGIFQTERKIISIYPNYTLYKDIDNPIKAIKIHSVSHKLSHRDFLGSLLGLGINRDKIGDILIHRDYAQVIIKDEISDYILANLEKVGNINIKVQEIKFKDLNIGILEYKNKFIVVPSIRLDTIISGAWNLSRNDSKKLIESGRVRVNWEPIEKAFKDIEAGDIISVKGYGRLRLESVAGFTRKDNIKIKLILFK